MAFRSLESLYQCHSSVHSLLKLRFVDSHCLPTTLSLPPATKSGSLSLSVNISSSSLAAIFAVSSATSTAPSTSQQGFSNFDALEQYLAAQNFRQADEETRRLVIVLGGEAAQKRGYVFFSEVQFMAVEDLKAIDELWKKYSNHKFGYSVQRRIWKQKANMDFTRFFLKVGWMKKLDTEVEQFNYRSFPTEFMWELSDNTPDGHLPLTNALRGTQLLSNILSHPAFDGEDEDIQEPAAQESDDSKIKGGVKGSSNPLNKKVFKTDYSF